nr:MAG TPA: hypothetical protein [Bacteriophage sp.]
MYFVIYILMSCFAFTLSLVRGHDVRESYFRAPLGPLYIVYAIYQILVGDKVVYDKQKINHKEQQEKDSENIIIKI